MLTPIEIQGKSFKSGIGYDKKDVEAFFKVLYHDYEQLYKENVEQTDKLNVLSEGIQYYKSIEKTLQKALVLAEKTAEDTQKAARDKAELIIKDSKSQAKEIILDAQKELDRIHLETINMAQQLEKYKANFRNLATTQLELLNSEIFNLKIEDVMVPIGQVHEKEQDDIQVARFVNKSHKVTSVESNSQEEAIMEETERLNEEDALQDGLAEAVHEFKTDDELSASADKKKQSEEEPDFEFFNVDDTN